MKPLGYKWYIRLCLPGGKFVLKPSVVTLWLKEKTKGVVNPENVWHVAQCSFCWVNPLFAKGSESHVSSACLVLATFNKLRKNASLTPITHTRTGPTGSMQKTPVKAEAVQEDTKKWQKEFWGMLLLQDKCLMVAEKKCSIKRKAKASESSSNPAKKNKTEKGRGKAGVDNRQSAVAKPKQGSLLGGRRKKKGKSKQQDNTSCFQVIDDRD